MRDVSTLGRHDDWGGVRVLVTGLGVSGFAAADNLTHLGAQVVVVDDSHAGERTEKATLLEILGADVRLGPGATSSLPDVDLVVTSPGWRPDAPLLAEAAARGLAVWGEVELAWRLRDPDAPAPWLAVTGTNGKTTTVQMLEGILLAAGLRAVACGNVGLPVTEVVMDPAAYDVLAVELSSFQLHWTRSMACESAAVLNVAEDHLDWHGSMAAYAGAKGRVYEGVQRACVYNVADPTTEELVREADVVEGARAIGFTLGIPRVGMVGVVDEVLADRAFVERRDRNAAELCTLADLDSSGTGPAPHNVANALAAAALARAHGVSQRAVRDGLRAFRLGAHRIAQVAEVAGVRYVDDSKATNPHAARSSLEAFDSVVWVAGGLAKGARFEELVQAVAPRLRGAVLLGRDWGLVADALARHASQVPVIEVADGEDDVMDRVLRAAAELAAPGDTVLLAPACASMDMFANYAARGDAFAEAARRLGG